MANIDPKTCPHKSTKFKKTHGRINDFKVTNMLEICRRCDKTIAIREISRTPVDKTEEA